MAKQKQKLAIDVYTAAEQRIAWAFDTFERLYISFSGGKDSTVMLHMVMAEAIRRKRKVGVLFVDLEGQYKMTIEHTQQCFDMYADHIEPFWVALPLNLRNAVSVFEPQWVCWDEERRTDWIREPPDGAITDVKQWSWFSRAMEFEDFVPAFGQWYAQGKLTCCFVGIRSDESLNRWRTIAGHGTKWEGHPYTQYLSHTLWNHYPIYDWKTEDIWTFHGKQPDMPYNRLYDLMHQAGLSIHQARICQPYGDDQRRGLWLFQLIEPETWAKVVARVNGANSGALYVQESGNINGYNKITKPPGHTWQSFAMLLLASMPDSTREHYENKIAIFIKWWMDRGYFTGIPDEADPKLEAGRDAPSWRRICKTLLRNDYWCKGLSFDQHKSGAYSKYQKIMKNRRQQWGSLW